MDQHRFVASTVQLAAAAAAVAVVVLVATRLRGRQVDSVPGGLRATLLSTLLGVLAAGAFQVIRRLPGLSPWIDAAALLATWAVTILIMVSWRRHGAGPVPFGLAAGAVITYGWVGLLPALRAGTGAVLEQSVLVIIPLALLVWTGVRSTRRAGLQLRPERLPVPH